MTKQLERALEMARKAQRRADELARHERLVALSVQCTKSLRANDYAAAYDAATDVVKELESAEQARKESE